MIPVYSQNEQNMGMISCIFIIICVSICILLPSSLLRAENSNSIVTGYDSFIDHYTILQDDTTEILNEYYTSLTNRFAFDNAKMKPELGNSLKIGNQTVGNRMDLGLQFGRESFIKTELKTDLYIKHFRENSDYSFSNDYKQLNTRLNIGRKFSDNIEIYSRSRLEIVDYENRTEFDYDYNYIDTGVEISAGSILNNLFHVSASYGSREAPDTTALSYKRQMIELDAFISPDGKYRHNLSVLANRRKYSGSSRSSLWNLYSFYRFTLLAESEKEYSIELDGESSIYDSPSSIYFDTHFVRAGLKVSIPFTDIDRISIEPRYARMFCDQYSEERYQEYSIIAGVEIMDIDNFWCMLSYEPGRRNYLKEENELYSDFYLNRLSIMGSISIYSGISADIFIIHDPETHTRKEDDFSITLISVSLSKRF